MKNKNGAYHVTTLLLSAGANATLSGTAPYTVVVSHDQGPDVSLTAFALGSDERVRNDGDMVFYNQNARINVGIEWVPPKIDADQVVHALLVTPAKWSGGIERVRIGLTVDRGLTFGKVANLQAKVIDASGALITGFDLNSRSSENAFIVADIYKRNGQLKAKCQAAGFEIGLAGLARDVGVTIDDEPAEVHLPAVMEAIPPSVNLVKKLAEAELPTNAAPIDLRKKKLAVVLVKNNLDGKTYRVVLLIDASGSMDRLFAETGRGFKRQASIVQRSLERMVPVADLLDDNHEMEVWYFGTKPSRSESVTIATMEGYVGRTKKRKNAAGWSNDEVAAMSDVMKWVRGNPSQYPTLVLAWSDGGVGNEEGIKQFLIDASSEAVFWMWLGLGGSKSMYGALARFDMITGGVVDNAGFEHIDDIEKMTDEDLYGKIFTHVGTWNRAAVAAGII